MGYVVSISPGYVFVQKYNPPEMFPGSRSVEMGLQDEKKPLAASGADVVWRVRLLPRQDGGAKVRLRVEADSEDARDLLGDLDVWGHHPVVVQDIARTVERDPRTGGFQTVGLTLVLSQ
jgi:hypothetical protein